MFQGMAITLLAAIFLGTFALPAKYVKNFEWENTWSAFFFFGMFLVPVAAGFLMVDGLWETYSQVSTGVIFGVMALGFVWGVGFCMWGHGLAKLGLSIGYALTMGTMALVGSMLPFFLGGNDPLTLGGMVIILGILICIVGVAINGIAGVKREQAEGDPEALAALAQDKKKTIQGVLICVGAGVFSSGANIGWHIGSNVGDINVISAEQFGNPAWLAGLAVWTLAFIGAGISSCGFTIVRATQKNAWKHFTIKQAPMNLFLILLMAIGHFLCMFFYGLGSFHLGVLGTSVGFAIFQSGGVITGNVLGFMTGEWKTAIAESKRWLYTGLAVLIGGIIVLSIGNMLS